MTALREHGLFRKVDHPSPDVAMGACYVYHTSGPGVDTGVLIEFEGTLFLGNTAIRELAECAGMNVLEDAVALEQEVAITQQENTTLLARVAELEGIIADDAKLFARLSPAEKRATEPAAKTVPAKR